MDINAEILGKFIAALGLAIGFAIGLWVFETWRGR